MSKSDLLQGISITPDICGGEACIAGTRIPVWLLVQAHALGTTDEILLASYPTLRANDLTNAWNYASVHPHEIEQQIQANENA